MKSRKFSSPAKAAKFAKAFGVKVKKGKACTLSDGRKGNLYSIVKIKPKKRK